MIRNQFILTLLVVAFALPNSARSQPVIPASHRLQPNAEQAGALLVDALLCAACHVSDPADRRTAPVLTAAGARLRVGFLREYLNAPHAAKPGTTMPDPLAGLPAPQRRDAVDALVHFLASLQGVPPPALPAGSAERGRRLYHEVGCVACHAPEVSYVPEGLPADTRIGSAETPSTPLGPLKSKYRSGQLAAFLLDPLAVRPSARMPRTPLTPQEAADIASYLEASPGQPESIELDPAKAAKGRELFSSLACASCHELQWQGALLASAPHARPYADLRGSGRGCLAERPVSPAPDFRLSAPQRAAIAAALRNNTPAPLLAVLNCYACHERDGIGGPDPVRSLYFASVNDADLGVEGRFPPPLTGAGAKLQPEALRSILQGKAAVRPYMATRMPDYGASNAGHLTRIFQADLSPNIEPVVRTGRNMYGRQLAGTDGLGCIVCHDLRGRKSLGIGAIDLAHAPKRLRPEWFRDFLIHPARFRPETRMPSYWPSGKAMNRKILGGNTARQIDGLWVYLMEIDQSELPIGLQEKGALELKPSGKPIVFRTFFEGAGTHAIAVGFPQKIHAVFDARQMRWALAWRGRFLDPEGTWIDRFNPPAQPLSDDRLALPAGPTFSPDTARYRFHGYRLDARGIPTFLYDVENLSVEDRIEPSPDGRSLKRTLRLKGQSSGLHRRPLSGGAPVPVTLDGGSAEIVEELTW